mmetsp:Transcript_26160/g.34780  ORF Transcript_26160/g.34780 Transcript_26160/m.34780 type:complete len:203 (-) Transcript_26160:3121-3729(-)
MSGGFLAFSILLPVPSLMSSSQLILAAKPSRHSMKRSLGKCSSWAIQDMRSNLPADKEKLSVSTAQPRGGSSYAGTALDSRRVKDTPPQSSDDILVKSSAPEVVASLRAALEIVGLSEESPMRERGPIHDKSGSVVDLDSCSLAVPFFRRISWSLDSRFWTHVPSFGPARRSIVFPTSSSMEAFRKDGDKRFNSSSPTSCSA